MPRDQDLITKFDERLSKLPQGPGMAAIDVFDTFDLVRQWCTAHGETRDIYKTIKIVEIILNRRAAREAHERGRKE